MPDDSAQSVSVKQSRFKQLLSPSWEKRKRMLRVEAWLFVIASYVLMAFAYLWPTDFRNTSPAYVWAAWGLTLVRTFLFHYSLILLSVSVVTLWKRSWRLFAASLPLLAISLGPTLWQYRPRSAPAVAGEVVTVMSVNLLMVNKTTAPIIEEIKTVAPDVLLLQEYTWHWHKALQAALGSEYPHVEYITREDSFGAAVYSRRPFVEKVEIFTPLGEAIDPQIRAVIEVAHRKVAFYNIHLLPPWGLMYIIEHRAQFADLLDALENEPLPVVMGGDFNFTENSPQVSALSRLGFADAQDAGGWGRGATWPNNSFFRWIPSIRLDHVYLGGGLTCTDCRTGVGAGSDHRPLIARIGFAR